MQLTIDNLQGLGAQDYTAALDGTQPPRVERKLNQPAVLQFSLVSNSSDFVIPEVGARVMLQKTGGYVFTGYLISAAQYEYMGWGERGPVYRYNLIAESDEMVLDQKEIPNRCPFVERSAGSALRQLAQNLLPGWFDTSAVQDLDTLASYAVNPQKMFSFHAGEIALSARASYRAMNGALMLAPLGAATYALNESDMNFSPEGLLLDAPSLLVNTVTAIGADEPEAYVRDYFVGDGVSLKYYLSQTPFAQSKTALIDEQYMGPTLDPTTWAVTDPSEVISTGGQTLQVTGGTGVDGQTTVAFIEQIELGGALALQHGDVTFAAASQGVIGGLYTGAIVASECLAGFQVTPSGSQSAIQALVNGSLSGPVITTTAGHRYVLTTYFYSMEVYRAQQTYHSSAHPAGNGLGGGEIAANVRFVLEVQDIDPGNPETLVAPPTILYDDVVSGAPGFCTYALVNAANLQCNIAYTYVAHNSLPEVRVAAGGEGTPFVTQIVGAAADGAECAITSDPGLSFYAAYAPVANELIVVSYRGHGPAVAQVQNAGSVAALATGTDDGTRGIARTIKIPAARTDADCENAALAVLDDGADAAWSGTYRTWSDFLPGAASDIFPGDGIKINVPSRNAVFTGIVREVQLEIADPANDRAFYTIGFANDLASSCGIQEEASAKTIPLQDAPPLLTTAQVGSYYQANLTDAQITDVTATTVTVDAGFAPTVGLGIEVRIHDFAWGEANNSGLVGRFNTQTFTLPRITGRTQNYFLRLYDNSSPPRYSRYSAALHVDYPLT